MDPNLVILAGGISSRMKRSSSDGVDPHLAREAEEKTKSMIGIGPGSRPFMDYLLMNARAAGYADVTIVVGEQDRFIREHYGVDGRPEFLSGMSISYVEQPIPEGRTKPLGTADALLRALLARPGWRGKRFTVCNSDNLYSVKALRLLLESTSDAAMIDYDRAALRFDEQRIAQFAVVRKDAEGKLLEIREKPGLEELARAREMSGRVGVSMNIWRFSYDQVLPLLQAVPADPLRQEKELPAAVALMIVRFPGCLTAIPLSEHVPDLTSKDDIVRVREFLLSNSDE